MKNADTILSSYLNNENRNVYISYSQDAIATLLESLGNPQNSFPAIHIAGTNGKGSTAFYIAKIFSQAGYKTGLFTSPHLETICERIRIDEEMISEEKFAYYSQKAEAAVKKMTAVPTFFDMVTATSFLYFKEYKVDIAVIETGLGGRRDSTNVIDPLCSVITSISLDHTDILGDTLGKITAEKAGIIKAGRPLVTSNTSDEITSILRDECLAKSSPFYAAGGGFEAVNIRKKHTGYIYDLRLKIDPQQDVLLKDITIDSPVFEQIENTSCAITAAMLLSGSFEKITASRSTQAVSGFNPPGRFQILSQNPLMIYDPAHNPAAVSSLAKALSSAYPQKKITAITAFMEDKKHSVMLDSINAICKDVVYYQFELARAYRPEQFNGEIITSSEELILYIEKKITKDSLFLFTGSFRLFPYAAYAAEKLKEKTNIDLR
ncbi:MAG: bifunctional folylpolyglutamate synthase/dihydrofolate synthase [Leptospirales bacterium]|nr:bifunctional folylpolyglutamate synthase/dihydrofolate synthase [Leptospirales bacterium]